MTDTEKKRRYRNRALGCFATYRRGARLRGLTFEPSLDDVARLTRQPCTYCGRPPLDSKATGIERVDNSKSYTAENSVPCCALCNRAKRAMPVKDFLDWISQLAALNA